MNIGRAKIIHPYQPIETDNLFFNMLGDFSEKNCQLGRRELNSIPVVLILLTK
jgi:hypothetical protein